jgi:hypothetical protein
MSSGVKTGLIVAAAAGGAFLLFKAFAPSPASVKQQATNSGIANLAGLANLAGGLAHSLGGLFGGGGSIPNDNTYHANAADFQVTGNQLIDPSTGGAVTYGAGY